MSKSQRDPVLIPEVELRGQDYDITTPQLFIPPVVMPAPSRMWRWFRRLFIVGAIVFVIGLLMLIGPWREVLAGGWLPLALIVGPVLVALFSVPMVSYLPPRVAAVTFLLFALSLIGCALVFISSPAGYWGIEFVVVVLLTAALCLATGLGWGISVTRSGF